MNSEFGVCKLEQKMERMKVLKLGRFTVSKPIMRVEAFYKIFSISNWKSPIRLVTKNSEKPAGCVRKFIICEVCKG